MPRKRMIDPSIWQDEGMAELTPRQQLLYIGLFSNADDDGRLKGSAAAVRLVVPTVYADTTIADTEDDLAAILQAMRQVRRYEADGRIYLVFTNFRQWQRIDKPSPSNLPAPPESDGDSPTPPVSLADTPSSDTGGVPPSRREEKRREEKRREEEESPPTPQGAMSSPRLLAGGALPRADQGRFDRFWRAYPRRESKAEAVKWWQRHRPDEATVALMLDAIARKMQAAEWQQEGGRYINLPSTWLNQRRWEDEPASPLRALPHNHPQVARARQVYD